MNYLPKDTGTWVRLIALIVTFVNLALVQAGKSPIPYDETAVGQWVSLTLTAIVGGYSYYKNNSHTDEGKIGTNVTRNLRNGDVDIEVEREEPAGPKGQ